MTALPFALRRPWLLLRGACTNRDRPALERLRRVSDPERFVWAILPHAARTFSACITLLPTPAARAAAVGYLYCRILDTYEDLHPQPAAREAALRHLAGRLRSLPLSSLPPLPAAGRDRRDQGHLLLVERCHLVDRVFATLPARHRELIGDLVAAMAEGMAWSCRVFDQQGGVLRDEAQLCRYCRNVLGYPVVFTTRLFHPDPLPETVREDAMRVGEMLQLANITRDLEKDLARGIGYHPRLAPLLGTGADADGTVRGVRRELLLAALERVPAYRRLFDAVHADGAALPRASALLMLLFTSRHYRSCARQVGLPAWAGPDSTPAVLSRVLPAALSAGYTRRALARVERDFLETSKVHR